MRDVQEDSRPTNQTRMLLLLIACGLGLVFTIACWLVPDPQGFGTHQQLGLPACQFRTFLGIHCPHCGMTTSFCNVVRGNFGAAYQSNPLGLPLALTWAACIPWCLSIAVFGRWVGTSEPFQWLVFGTILYLLLAVVFWVVRTFI